MSVRNLDRLFKPKSVAVIGASTHAHSVGNIIVRNLLGASYGGKIFPVNPAHDRIEGLACYPDIAALPEAPDLAVICTPARTVPDIVSALGRRGTKGVVVISAGFKESSGEAGAQLEDQMLQAAQPHLLRIIGPNCLGVMAPTAGLNVSFAHLQPARGGVAFVSQSGAMLTTLIDWAADRDIGFSHLVSLGDMADVDFGDMLDYLAKDAETTTILLYAEAVTNAAKFMRAARAAAAIKPVIVLKAGRHVEAAKAARSHTGALAGSDDVYAAVFRRAGLLRAFGLEDACDAIEILSRTDLANGDRIAILTNGGGAGVLATDALLDGKASLANLSDKTIASLDAILPAAWSRANPVDIIGDAPPDRYAASLNILLSAPEVDWVLVQNCPTAIGSSAAAAQAVITTAAQPSGRIVANWLGEHTVLQANRLFQSAGIPHYPTPDRAARAFCKVIQYRQARTDLAEGDSDFPRLDKGNEIGGILQRARDRGDDWLPPQDIDGVLRHCGISAPRSAFAADLSALKKSAAGLVGPMVLKIQSPDIIHKSDVGGVVVGLPDSAAVNKAAEDMLVRISKAAPLARISGFFVQETVELDGGIDLIAGMTTDPTFGPVMMFGRGGKAVEVVNDKSLMLAPLNQKLARDMIQRTRVYRELVGYRDQPAMDIDAIIQILLRLSSVVTEYSEISDIEINPLRATVRGVLAVDTRLRLARKNV